MLIMVKFIKEFKYKSCKNEKGSEKSYWDGLLGYRNHRSWFQKELIKNCRTRFNFFNNRIGILYLVIVSTLGLCTLLKTKQTKPLYTCKTTPIRSISVWPILIPHIAGSFVFLLLLLILLLLLLHLLEFKKYSYCIIFIIS